MRKALFSTLFVLLTALTLATGPEPAGQKGSVLLIGKIDKKYADVHLITYQVGVMPQSFKPDCVNRTFGCLIDGVKDFADIAVVVDGRAYGARINVNDTLKMTFTSDSHGGYSVEYQGRNEKECRIFTDIYRTYCDMRQYDFESPEYDYVRTLELIRKRDSKFRTTNKDNLDAHYSRLADMMYACQQAVAIEIGCHKKGEGCMEWPEYVSVMKDIDPNDPYAVSAGLIYKWTAWKMYQESGGYDESRLVEDATAFMDRHDKDITNPVARSTVATYLAQESLERITCVDDQKYYGFIDRLKAFVPEYDGLIEDCLSFYETFKATSTGQPMHDASLIAPDGSEIKLSSLFGKVLYIDFWASWCGPCIRETPYMAKLAEHYRGSEDITFISISVDEEKADWLKAVNAGKHEWAQYWLKDSDDNEFQTRMGINQIPRFIIVDKEGKIYEGYAERPSNEYIIPILEYAIRNQGQK